MAELAKCATNVEPTPVNMIKSMFENLCESLSCS